jgi:transcriptional regulator with GAF, ATPase, and Fis domain|tara:strand:- start:3 stop:329 length:327 start_codon:yes stop_codon:yes gene_type:complete
MTVLPNFAISSATAPLAARIDELETRLETIERAQQNPLCEDALSDNFLMTPQYAGLQSEISGLVCHRIRTALNLSKGNKTAAAELLGLPSYQTLANWMHKHGIESYKG